MASAPAYLPLAGIEAEQGRRRGPHWPPRGSVGIAADEAAESAARAQTLGALRAAMQDLPEDEEEEWEEEEVKEEEEEEEVPEEEPAPEDAFQVLRGAMDELRDRPRAHADPYPAVEDAEAGHSRHYSEASIRAFRAERIAAESAGMHGWEGMRGPLGPQEGGPQTWRGQQYRPGSQRWANRGGRNREYFAWKYGGGRGQGPSRGGSSGSGSPHL